MNKDIIIKKYRTYHSSIDRSGFNHFIVYKKQDGSIYKKPVGEKEFDRAEIDPFKVIDVYKISKTILGLTYYNKYIAVCKRLSDNTEYEINITKSEFKQYS